MQVAVYEHDALSTLVQPDRQMHGKGTFSNSTFGVDHGEKHGQRLSGAEEIAYELPSVDFRLLAESMGIPGYVIHSPQELEDLDLDAILRRKGPTLLDVRIDPEEVPPMNVRMKTLKCAK